MQRPPQSNTAQAQGQGNSSPYMSPAYTMAARIRNEQGRERAGEYLAAMEPFLAPGERAHIASQLGVPLVQCAAPPPPPPAQSFEAPPRGPDVSQMFSQLAQQQGGMNNVMQMMQLMKTFGAMGGEGKGAAPGMGNLNSTLMLAQMLGMMGKK